MKTKSLICVVDDDSALRESLSDLLRAAGYRAAGFESAECYLASDERGGCGWVVADIHMPGLTGIDLAKQIGAGADGGAMQRHAACVDQAIQKLEYELG